MTYTSKLNNILITTVFHVKCRLLTAQFSFQAFYPTKKEVHVKYGDTIAARCGFTGEGRTSKTYIG